MKSIVSVSNNNLPCDFTTIAAALDSIPSDNTTPVTIFLQKGIYREKLMIQKPFVTLIGEDAVSTIIEYDDYALMTMEDGSKRGTFRTPTVFIDTNDFTARNITFLNSAGLGRKVGQALALYIDGDRIVFDGCRMLASQDTIFTGPLPPTPYQLGGFTGPKEFAPRINGRQYFHNCHIRGDVDFIFGSATAYFDHCEIFSQKTDDLPPATNENEQKIYGYITAASTAEGQEYGYVFSNCSLMSDCPANSVYLGRPWRSFAKTVFLNCYLDAHIRSEGWDDWNKADAHETIFYAEYKSFGPGATPLALKKRAGFSHQLNDETVEMYSKEKVLGGTDHWLPPLFL